MLSAGGMKPTWSLTTSVSSHRSGTWVTAGVPALAPSDCLSPVQGDGMNFCWRLGAGRWVLGWALSLAVDRAPMSSRRGFEGSIPPWNHYLQEQEYCRKPKIQICFLTCVL